MKKIISLFQRNYDGDRLVRDEVVPGAEWVLAGEGTPTRKFDGTCCLIREGRLYKRYDLPMHKTYRRDLKQGKLKPPFTPDMYVARPLDWEAAEDTPDSNTGHWPGWLPVGDGPEDQWHREAWAQRTYMDGTYELVGPKVQGNAETYTVHMLLRHGSVILDQAPRDFEGIRDYLASHDFEGIVWHNDDGRMVKIKAKDFGLKRTNA